MRKLLKRLLCLGLLATTLNAGLLTEVSLAKHEKSPAARQRIAERKARAKAKKMQVKKGLFHHA